MSGTPGADDETASAQAGANEAGEPACGTTADAEPPAGSTTAEGAPRPEEVKVARWRRRLDRAWELADQTWKWLVARWQALRAYLDNVDWPEQPPPPLPVTLIERRVPRPFKVPAQGRVYDFVVQATFTWSSETTRPEVFWWYVDTLQWKATQRLWRLAATAGRDIAPNRVREMETALQTAVVAKPELWTFSHGDQELSCEVDVTVLPDEPVRRIMQRFWDERIALDCERDLGRRRARNGTERQRHRAGPTKDPSTPPSVHEPDSQPDQPPEARQETTGGAGAPPGPAAGARRKRPSSDSPAEQSPLLDISPGQSLTPPRRSRAAPPRQPGPRTPADQAGDPAPAPAPAPDDPTRPPGG